MSAPPGLVIPPGLTVLTDRDLGSRIVPERLREVGLDVVTIAEHYGQTRAQHVADVEWIAEACRRGWVIFSQDQKIRHNLAEKTAIRRHAARMFCVPNGNITGRQAAQRYVDNLPAILAAAGSPGPFIYGVYPSHIQALTLT